MNVLSLFLIYLKPNNSYQGKYVISVAERVTITDTVYFFKQKGHEIEAKFLRFTSLRFPNKRF